MIDVLYILYLLSILVSAVMAVIYRKDLATRKLVILVPFLIIVFFQESTLRLTEYLDYSFSSAVIYNIYRPVSALVFSWIYYRVPFMSPLKKLIAGLTILYVFITLINYCFITSIFFNSSYLTLLRGFLITFCAILFLFRYFNLDNLKEEKYWRPLVWITAGIAVFYPVVTLSVTFQDYLDTQDATLFGFKLYRVIPQVISIFMYSCFSYAFYLCRKIRWTS